MHNICLEVTLFEMIGKGQSKWLLGELYGGWPCLARADNRMSCF